MQCVIFMLMMHQSCMCSLNCNLREDLHNALPNPFEPFWVQGGGHNNLEVMAREPFFKRLKEYVFNQDFVYTAS